MRPTPDPVLPASGLRPAVDEGGVRIVPTAAPNVLVAADQADLRGKVVAGLRDLGYRVLEASSGQELGEWIERICRWAPVAPIVDVVVVDRDLADLPDLATLARLQCGPVTTPLLLLGVTARGRLQIETLQAGVWELRPGTFSPAMLGEVVDHLVYEAQPIARRA